MQYPSQISRFSAKALLVAAFAVTRAAQAAELSAKDVVMYPGTTASVVISGDVDGESTFGVTIRVELVAQAGATGTVEFTPAPPMDISQVGDPWPDIGTFSGYDTDVPEFATLNASIDDNGSYVAEAVTFSGSLVAFPIVASADAQGVWEARLSTSKGDSSWEGLATTLAAGSVTVSGCLETSQCGAGQVCCDNQCVQCCNDADCASGELCCSNICRAWECCNDSDCGGATPVCRTTDHTCVECITDAHCTDPDRPYCGWNNTCFECIDDSDCPGFGCYCLETAGDCTCCIHPPCPLGPSGGP